MTRKRKNKNIILDQEASDYLRRKLNSKIIPYNPIIIEKEKEDDIKRDKI